MITDELASVPKHVGIIPDGARRWAKEHRVSYLDSYMLAMQGITQFISFMFERGVSSLCIYLLSKENLRRPPSDLDPVFASEAHFLRELLPPIVDKFNCQVIHAGQMTLLPPDYAEALARLTRSTLARGRTRLYLLAAYDPFDEIAAARADNPHTIGIAQLWVPEPLDLVVRTSGERRLSNFLPLQAAYAEIIFTNKYFNDLCREDYAEFLQVYSSRIRRFGL